jgi:hypothetical protein
MGSKTSGQSFGSDPRFAHRPLNGCGGCHTDFTSLRLFDAHRVGDHALTWPEHENGRRCRDAEEMTEKGWQQDDRGRWFDPVHRERTRDYFGGASAPCTEGPNSPSEAEDEEVAAA